MKRHALIGLFLVLLAVGTVACNRLGGGQQAGPIKIGILVPLSGPSSQGGEQMKNAFELAAEEINAAGGVNGQPIELIFEDTGGDPQKGVTAAKKLIEQDQVWGLAGLFTSGVALAVAPVAMEAQKPLVVTVAAAPDITGQVAEDPETFKYLFRTGAHVVHFALNTEPFVVDIVGAKSYYYIAQDALWAKGLGQVFEAQLGQKGIQKVGETFVQRGTEEFASPIADIQAKNPDVVIAALVSAEGVPFAKQYYDAQVPIPFVATAGVLTFEENVKGMGEKANYVNFFAWAWDIPITEKTQPFYKNFKEKYGFAPSGYEDVRSYDGLHVMVEALKQAGSQDPDKWAEAMQNIRYTGVAGIYEFDESHQAKWGEGLLTGVLGQWRDGQAVIFWPEAVANGEFQKAPWWK